MPDPIFRKLIICEKTNWLLSKFPNAFLLLTLIAIRARRYAGHLDSKEIGDAHIGDWKACGLSEQQYRTAIKKLVSFNFIKIKETNRTRKKSTTGVTTEGTLVTLLNSDIWDVNLEESNDRINDRATTEQRLSNDEQEYKEIKNDKNKNKKEKIKKEKIPEVLEIPKIAYRQFVTLTEIQYQSLINENEKSFVDLMLDELNSYKGSTGKKYDSDFYTMIKGGWVYKKIAKDSKDGKTYKKPDTIGNESLTGEPRFKGRNVLSITRNS